MGSCLLQMKSTLNLNQYITFCSRTKASAAVIQSEIISIYKLCQPLAFIWFFVFTHGLSLNIITIDSLISLPTDPDVATLRQCLFYANHKAYSPVFGLMLHSPIRMVSDLFERYQTFLQSGRFVNDFNKNQE